MYHQKTIKWTKCLEKNTFSFIIHFEFLVIHIIGWSLLMQRGKFANLLSCVTCFWVSYQNFIFSNSKFQVEIKLHISFPYVDLVDLVNLALHVSYMLVIKRKNNSFVVHLEFIYNRCRPMINLKELALVNETIRHLRYKTSRYINV